MTKTAKIIFLLTVLALGGWAVYQWQQKRNKATIQILKEDRNNKSVAFKMSYKDLHFKSTIKLGGIHKQELKGYVFEATTQGQQLLFSIKDPSGVVLTKKVVDFSHG